MANILYRESLTPTQPAATVGGSAAKASPLTNNEGDWNFYALNTDLALKATSANPNFTGVVTYSGILRTANYNQYDYAINGAVVTTGVQIGTYLPTSNNTASLHITLTGFDSTSGAPTVLRAVVYVSSGTMPASTVVYTTTADKTSATVMTMDVWKDSAGKIFLFANPGTNFSSLEVGVRVWEASIANGYTSTTSVTAKNTTGMTVVAAGSRTMDFGAGSGITATNFYGALTGNATTATTLATARAINGVNFDGSAPITITANTTNGLTFDNSGTGAASGTAFNGGTAYTISYNTVGAPSTTGAGASGTWGINVTGTAANVTGVVAVANGGTGQTTATAAYNASKQTRSVNMNGAGSPAAGIEYSLNTPGGTAFNATLPANPSIGDEIVFLNGWRNWTTGQCTIVRGNSAHTINGLAEDVLINSNAVYRLVLTYVWTNIWVMSAS